MQSNQSGSGKVFTKGNNGDVIFSNANLIHNFLIGSICQNRFGGMISYLLNNIFIFINRHNFKSAFKQSASDIVTKYSQSDDNSPFHLFPPPAQTILIS